MSKERKYIRIKRKVRRQRLHEQGCQCAICGEIRKPHELDAHHIQQAQHGGSSTDARNVVMVCRGLCHDIANKDAEQKIPWEDTRRRFGSVMPEPPRLVRRS